MRYAALILGLVSLTAYAQDACNEDSVWYGCRTQRIVTVVCADKQDGARLLDDIAASGGIANTVNLIRTGKYKSCDIPQNPQVYYVGHLIYRVGPFILVDSPIETMPYITLESEYVVRHQDNW